MDEFICISCWKEFSLAHDDVVRQEGKVVCPNCGYNLKVDASERTNPDVDTQDGIKVESGSLDVENVASDLSEVIDWGEFSGNAEDKGPATDLDVEPSSEEFPADLTPPDGAAIELPPPIPDETADGIDDDDEIGFDDPAADEKTPLEPLEAPGLLLDTEDHEMAKEPVEWRLRTSSGLTFRFTDPDALLGWKKKINIYREMHVSPNGEDWVDYVLFVKRFESCGNATTAFRTAGKTTEELLVPEMPPSSTTALKIPEVESSEDLEDEDSSDETSEGDAAPQPRSNVPTTQFTFRTADQRGSRGKQVLLLVVGLGLGACAAWLALTYLQVI